MHVCRISKLVSVVEREEGEESQRKCPWISKMVSLADKNPKERVLRRRLCCLFSYVISDIML
jgi:hypothetical protein